MDRICYTCETPKPLDADHFPRRTRNKCGFAYQCRDCNKAAHAAWYARDPSKATEGYRKWRSDNPEKELQTRVDYRRRLKERVLRHYSSGDPRCNCCGESVVEFLTMDHKNGGGNQHRKQGKFTGGTSFYRWLEKNEFPPDFQVLCFNCNCGKFPNGKCPHSLRTPPHE